MPPSRYQVAFPSQADAAHEGMSLRQWYAGLAMQALIAKAEIRPTTIEAGLSEDFRQKLVRESYKIADEMVFPSQSPPLPAGDSPLDA